jgi:hypothetical protein
MTLVLELDEATEARLRAEAEARGLAVEEYALGLLRKPDPIYPAGDGRPTLESLEAMFAALAKGSENRPVLPPEAFERESFYEDRG